jgi:predicted ATPase
MSNTTEGKVRSRLERITVKGFKTIRELIDFEPHARTVLIGPNGAGKSNFISLFRMMSWALSGPDKLALHVSQQGGSRRLLHDGPAHTHEIEAALTIRAHAGENEYAFRLFHAAGDTLVFADERYRFSRTGWQRKARWKTLGAGHKDPQLLPAAVDDQTAQVIRTLLQKIVVYQFHNTSDTARIRGKWPASDNRWLKEDAANIAPVLYRLQVRDRRYYQRIVDTIRLVLPLFSDFELEPDCGDLMLAWRERDTDEVFNASQASDGFLRMVALITLLLQPAQDLPDVLILDEPELGLHPSAINVVGELIAAAATKIQIIAATQSVPLVDCFDPEDIVVVERPDRASTFKRLDPVTLDRWLEAYSLSELWEKNIIGGHP